MQFSWICEECRADPKRLDYVANKKAHEDRKFLKDIGILPI